MITCSIAHHNFAPKFKIATYTELMYVRYHLWHDEFLTSMSLWDECKINWIFVSNFIRIIIRCYRYLNFYSDYMQISHNSVSDIIPDIIWMYVVGRCQLSYLTWYKQLYYVDNVLRYPLIRSLLICYASICYWLSSLT